MRMSQKQYAAHRKAKGLSGGSRRAVQVALEHHRITADENGLIDPEVADIAWAQNTNPAKVRGPVGVIPGPTHPAEPAAQQFPGGLVAGKQESVTEKQLELLTEKTLTARAKRLQLEGEVIAVADAEAAHGDQVEVAKRILLRIPDVLAIRLAASKDVAECRSMLEHEIRQALAAIQAELAA